MQGPYADGSSSQDLFVQSRTEPVLESRLGSGRSRRKAAGRATRARMVAAVCVVVSLVAALAAGIRCAPPDGRQAVVGSIVTWNCGVSPRSSHAMHQGSPEAAFSDETPAAGVIVDGDSTPRAGDPQENPGAAADGGPCAARMVWPVAAVRSPSQVIRRFDAPAQPWLPGHRGVDLPVTPGTAFVAPADATVRFAGRVAGKDVVSLLLDSGLVSTFEPARTRLGVGVRVQRGEVVGTVEGESDHCGHRCLHWGLRAARNDYRDPAQYVGLQLIGLKSDEG